MRDISLEDIRSDISSDEPIMEDGDCLHQHYDDDEKKGGARNNKKKGGK